MRPLALLLLGACGGAVRADVRPGAAPDAIVDHPAPPTPLLRRLWSDHAAVLVFCADSVLVDLQHRLGELEAAGAWVAAVSTDPPDKIRELVATLELGFPILSDPAGEAARAWSACDSAGPVAFVVAPGGRIVYRGRPDVNALLLIVKQ